MNGVDLRVVVGESFSELIALEPVEMPLPGKLAEQLGRVAFNVLGQREHAARLGEGNAAQLARPGVYVLEDEAMERLKVGKVVSTLKTQRG